MKNKKIKLGDNGVERLHKSRIMVKIKMFRMVKTVIMFRVVRMVRMVKMVIMVKMVHTVRMVKMLKIIKIVNKDNKEEFKNLIHKYQVKERERKDHQITNNRCKIKCNKSSKFSNRK